MKAFEQIPTDLFIQKDAHERMATKGEEELGFVQVEDPADYVLVNKETFQPGLQVDANTYQVTFIFK